MKFSFNICRAKCTAVICLIIVSLYNFVSITAEVRISKENLIWGTQSYAEDVTAAETWFDVANSIASCSVNWKNLSQTGTPCKRRQFASDSFVCVCDGKYCDTLPRNVAIPPSANKFRLISSSKDKYRFNIEEICMQRKSNGKANKDEIQIIIDYNQTYQSLIGFGGAFSDSAGMAVTSLSKEGQEKLLKAYFGPEGIEYNVGRIPIGGTDFSTRPYSYDDVKGDIELKHFQLAEEDFKFKIPLIQSALRLSKKKIRFIATAWSPPSWMKENGKINGKGGLLKDMVHIFTTYIIKFIRAYEKHGILFWGITSINEPLAGFMDWNWNACAFSAENTRDWIKYSLGPTLQKEKLRYLQLMIYEHGRDELPKYPAVTLSDPDAAKFVDGISVHWYNDRELGPEPLVETFNKFPDKFLMYTEACEGFDADAADKVVLGSWKRAENYAANVIENLNNHVSGWVDWNLALDMEGGPNWANNSVDASIIVNKKLDEFYKQPMFYALGHFSKFIQEDAVRISSSIDGNDPQIGATIFANPDKSYTAIVLNKSTMKKKIVIDTSHSLRIKVTLEPKSFNTILYV